MALLEILKYPDPRLRTVAKPVTEFNERLRQLVDDMFYTMYTAPGIGLAATQVDVHERLLVMDISEDKLQPLCLINPVLLEQSGSIEGDEGCLSVPEVYESVKRAEWVRVKALDRDGQELELEAEGMLAVCIQHEMDHLEGKLFVDYLSQLKRSRLKKKVSKARKHDQQSATSTPLI